MRGKFLFSYLQIKNMKVMPAIKKKYRKLRLKNYFIPLSFHAFLIATLLKTNIPAQWPGCRINGYFLFWFFLVRQSSEESERKQIVLCFFLSCMERIGIRPAAAKAIANKPAAARALADKLNYNHPGYRSSNIYSKYHCAS